MQLTDLVKAAQEYDLEHKPWGNWTRVPDSQVARLLLGAKLAKESEQRAVPPLPSDA